MSILKKAIIASSIAMCNIPAIAFNPQNTPATPSGWGVAETSDYGIWKGKSYQNVHIYKKNDEDTYVQLVDLAGGAQVKLLQYYGWNENGFNVYWKNTIKYWWDQMGTNTSRVSVINGQFFNHHKQYGSALSFPYKDGGYIESGGDIDNHTQPLKQIEFHPDTVIVKHWNDHAFRNSTAHYAIVGLHPGENKRLNERIGRTYLCAIPYPNNPSKNFLLVYTAKQKTQIQAENDLWQWKCSYSRMVMFDGSDSTQLYTKKYGPRISTNRKLPQAIGIYN